MKPKICIIGGGIGGLITSYLLYEKLSDKINVTIFDCNKRIGGKIYTRILPKTGARIETGMSEVYDYSQLGDDTLKNLILKFGLKIIPMHGDLVFFKGHCLSSDEDIKNIFGPKTWIEIENFDNFAKNYCSPEEYYDSNWLSDTDDLLAKQTFAHLLSSVKDQDARQYIEILTHSDIATEPHKTSAMYAIDNWLMNNPDYMNLYYIEGGLDQLIDKLIENNQAKIKTSSNIISVAKNSCGTYSVEIDNLKNIYKENFDYIIVCMPVNQLINIKWLDLDLKNSIFEHMTNYDYPGHYLRITLAFSEPFWKNTISGSYFMIDAFGGACVYDETSRETNNNFGVLSWLLAGDPALNYSNLEDNELILLALDSLPSILKQSLIPVVECCVSRWIGCVNGWPMGKIIKSPDSRHVPCPIKHSNIYLVGDYLYDSTVNGVMDGAIHVTDLIKKKIIQM